MTSSIISDYDRTHVGEIIYGSSQNWWEAHFLRLIHAAQPEDREKFRELFPEHVQAWEDWWNGTGPYEGRPHEVSTKN